MEWQEEMREASGMSRNEQSMQESKLPSHLLLADNYSTIISSLWGYEFDLLSSVLTTSKRSPTETGFFM